MTARVTDVIIHTRQLLDDDQFADLSRRVYGSDGVISLSRNVHTPRFLIVVYNAARIHSRQLLNEVKRQGCDASLVGI